MTLEPRCYQTTLRYRINLDWVWRNNRELNKTAVLKAEISTSDIGKLVQEIKHWLRGAQQNSRVKTYLLGGLEVRWSRTEKSVTVWLSSSGEDVAESMQWGVDQLCAVLRRHRSTVTVLWEELKLE